MASSPALATLSDTEFTQLAAAAIRAPSADNSQPWTLRRDAQGVIVGLPSTLPPTFFDFDGWASEVSLGAAVENVVQTAPGLGLDATLIPLGEREVLIRLLRLPERLPSAYGDAVAARHTNRSRFARKAVPRAVCDELERAVAAAPDFRMGWLTSSTARGRVIFAVQQAEHVRFTHAQIHAEFHQSLRFGAAQERHPEGLAADTLGLEPFLLPALRLLKPWPIASALNAIGMHHFMVWRGATLPLGRAPLIGVVTCRADPSGIGSGRVLERLWLAAEAAGMAFQAFGALPLLLRRLQRPAALDGLTASQRQRLSVADRAWREALGGESASDALVMVVRVGYAATTVRRSRRRPVETFIEAS